MSGEYIIILNGKHFCGESDEEYAGGDVWLSNSFHTRNALCNELIFKDDTDSAKTIIGSINLISWVSKIIKYTKTRNIPISSLNILCATCHGSGGIEIGEEETDTCPDCNGGFGE